MNAAYRSIALSLLVQAVLPSMGAHAGAPCPESLLRSLGRSDTVRLVSCEREGGYYFALQNYEAEDGKYAGITLSVYGAATAKPLAVQTGLGDEALSFKINGKTVDHWMLEPGREGKPGILFRGFNSPHVGVFASFRYNPSTKELEPVSTDVTSDADSIPEIKRDGSLTISGTGYDPEKDEEVPFKKAYQYEGGAFIPKAH